MVTSCSDQFHVDLWRGQRWRPEIWIEKDALLGVIEGICRELDVPYFSCRGYTSQTEMWVGAQRLLRYKDDGQTPIIFHLGDHDPSGLDMSRDIADRLEMFMGGTKLERLALNMDQVQEYTPPPNPAKTTDSRYQAYITKYGRESWELDALEPQVISDLIRANVTRLLDPKKWKARLRERKRARRMLKLASDNWQRVEKFLEARP